MSAPAGWYPDPEHPGMQRRWDGGNWTDERQPAPPTVPAAPRRRGGGCGLLAFLLLAIVIVIVVVSAIATAGQQGSSAPAHPGLTDRESRYLAAAQARVTAAGFVWTERTAGTALDAGSIACQVFTEHPNVDRSLAAATIASGGEANMPEELRPLFSGIVLDASTHLCPG